MTSETVGLFLTPGAPRGAYQAGAVEVLVKEGKIHFDVVAATSVGAVNGGWVATGQIDRMIEEWSSWQSRDVLRFDWKGVLLRGVWWARAFMTNKPERDVIERDLDEARLLPGVRLRANLANLERGYQEHFEWPGAPMSLAEGISAAVAVPVAVPPSRLLGDSWVDGLTVDGFPLEPLLLATGVKRAFVIGVAPRSPDAGSYRNPFRAVIRALEWNQYTETTLGLDRAEDRNRRIRAWTDLRAEVEAAVAELVVDGAERARLTAEVDDAFERSEFPFVRKPVQIIPILPDEETRVMFNDFLPSRSRALIEQGRRDARRVLEELQGPAPPAPPNR